MGNLFCSPYVRRMIRVRNTLENVVSKLIDVMCLEDDGKNETLGFPMSELSTSIHQAYLTVDDTLRNIQYAFFTYQRQRLMEIYSYLRDLYRGLNQIKASKYQIGFDYVSNVKKIDKYLEYCNSEIVIISWRNLFKN